jgi:flagellin-like hook-associated protein FlgL
MQVSTKLMNQQQVGQFGKLNANIADIQERISTGKKILRASDDPCCSSKSFCFKRTKSAALSISTQC